jgi:basic membrane protein A
MPRAADIIFQIAGATGQGVFEAAEQDSHYAIGVDSDQASIIEETDSSQAAHILTSMLKNIDNSIYRAIKLHIEGDLPYGQIDSLGVAEGGVGNCPQYLLLCYYTESVQELVDAAEDKIINGEIVVQTAF